MVVLIPYTKAGAEGARIITRLDRVDAVKAENLPLWMELGYVTVHVFDYEPSRAFGDARVGRPR